MGEDGKERNRRELTFPTSFPFSLPFLSFSYSDVVVIWNRTLAPTVRRYVSLPTSSSTSVLVSSCPSLFPSSKPRSLTPLLLPPSASRPPSFSRPLTDSQEVHRRNTLLELHQIRHLLHVRDQGESSEAERVEEGALQEENE